MEWLDGNRVKVTPPKRPKKLTGTRFAAVMGLNKWSTPFKVWCEVTRTYEEPFVDTIYTNAGKIIEPKQAQYMKTHYAMGNLVTPENIYGKDYFKKTFGDFFPEWDVLGGMWDYLLIGHDGKPCGVLEMKTTKRSEDWESDIPEYYALQAALYAYLLGVDDVYMVCSFLGDTDYENPEGFEPSVHNTIVRPFSLSERYPNMAELVRTALEWWKEHVLTGESPVYDEKADAEILKALKTNSVAPESTIQDMLAEAETFQNIIDANKAKVKDEEKRLEVLKKAIKDYAMQQFRDGDTKVTLTGGKTQWTLALTTTEKVDVDRLKEDGLTRYFTESSTYKLTSKTIKE